MEHQLKLLKKVFRQYSPFWTEWCDNKLNSLSDTDKYIISVFVQNEFKIASEEITMFYNRKAVIASLIEKLKADFDEFQNWAIVEYQFNLINLAKQNQWEIFWKTPIHGLPIPQVLRANLSFYKLNSLNDVFENYCDVDFKEERIFNNIVEFQKIIINTNLL